MVWNNPNLIKVLQNGGVVVMPTDTLYGIVGKAQNLATVEHIYALRKRSPNKPCIILIGNINELKKFSINLSEEQKNVLEEYWPISAIADIGHTKAVSIILDCSEEKFTYLHRGTKTLAFRLPASQELRDLLLKVGPLIAPSANIEGMPPAQNINEVKKYFGNAVDLYIDGSEIVGKASKIIKMTGVEILQIRP